MKALNVPGLSIVLIREATPVWNGTFGAQDIETRKPVTTETVFEAASLTKPLFAHCVLKQHEKENFDLDKPLHEMLPRPYTSENPGLAKTITARHVLTHSTGFPNWRTGSNDSKINFSPGQKFSYSGEDFVYLQRVVENLTQTPLDVWMKKQILDPLDMTNASLVWQEKFQANIASGYSRRPRKGAIREMIQPNSASSLVCSPADYAKFVCALLNPPANDAYICSPKTLDEMFTPAIPVADGVSWGFGIGVQHSLEADAFWHWGNNAGKYHSFFVGYPKHGLAIIVFTNSGNGLKLCQSIIPKAIGGLHPALNWPMVNP